MFDFSLQRDKLYKQVADRIQQLIVADSLKPGDKLPSERELADRMGVSRTVIREAIRALSVRGLVKVKSGCGTYVQEPSAKDTAAHLELFLKLKQAPELYQKVYEIRRMLEVEAAGLAAERATEQDLAAMEVALKGMAAHLGELEPFIQCDLAFHEAIAAATQNELFSILLSPISDLLREFIVISTQAPGSTRDGVAHHRSIIEFIKAREPMQARQAMHDHLAHAHDLVEAHKNAGIDVELVGGRACHG